MYKMAQELAGNWFLRLKKRTRVLFIGIFLRGLFVYEERRKSVTDPIDLKGLKDIPMVYRVSITTCKTTT